VKRKCDGKKNPRKNPQLDKKKVCHRSSNNKSEKEKKKRREFVERGMRLGEANKKKKKKTIGKQST